MSEETIFAAAIEKASPAERAAFLDGACGGDVELRQRIEALLTAHAKSGDLLDPFARDSAMTTDVTSDPDTGPIDHQPGARPITEGPGSRIGAYKLLQQIGEGGMGVVYMAEQDKPVRRKVALKIIKPGMDSRQVIARFEAERQALGDDGSAEHRLQGSSTPARLAERPARLPCHGAGPRSPDDPVLRRPTPHARAVRLELSSPSAGRSSMPIRRGSSTAISSPRTSW